MNSIRKQALDLIEYGRLAIIAMVMIVVVYLVANALFGQVPATIGAVIFGIAGTSSPFVKNKTKKRFS